MHSEDFPQQSGIDQSTTLGASENGAADDRSDNGAYYDGESEVDNAPKIDDVSGLEDLYTKTGEVATTGLGVFDSPTSVDHDVDGPVTTVDIPMVVAGIDDEAGFNPTRTEQIMVEGVRLPPPLELGSELKFSFEPGVDQTPAWSYDDGLDDSELIELRDERELAADGHEPTRPRAVRLPGQRKRKPSILDSASELAERRWFWAAAAVAAIAAVQGGLFVSGVMPNPFGSADRPDVVADGDGSQLTDPFAATTTENGGDETTESTNSARFGNGGVAPVGADGEGSDDVTETTASGSTAGRSGRKPTTTVDTTDSPGSTTSESTTTSSPSSTTSSSSTTQLTTTTTIDVSTTTSMASTTSLPTSTTTSTTATTTTTLTTTTDPDGTTTTTDPDGTTTTTDPDETTTTTAESTTTTDSSTTTTVIIDE